MVSNRRMKFLRTSLIIFSVIIIGWMGISYYSFIFSKTVNGEILSVKRITDPTAVMGSNVTAAQLHSYAILVRDEKDGAIYAASTEDRKWAVAKEGFCAKVTLYPYPPWELGKGGDFFNARYDNLRDCNNLLGKSNAAGASEPAVVQPVATATP